MIKKLSKIFTDKEIKSIYGLFLLILFAGLLETAGVASIMPFMAVLMNQDLIIENQFVNYIYKLTGVETVDLFLVILGTGVLFVFLCSNFFNAFSTYKTLKFIADKNYKISRKLLKKYIFMDYVCYLDKNTADLSKNILAESSMLSDGVLIPIAHIISRANTVLFIIILLLYIDPLISISSGAVLMGSYLIIYSFMRVKIKNYGELRLLRNSERYKISQEALEGIKDIKMFASERYYLNKFSKSASQFSILSVKNQLAKQLPRYFLESLAFGGVLGITLILLVTRSEMEKVIPVVSLFAMAGYRLIPGLQQIYASAIALKFNMPIVDLVCGELASVYNNSEDNYDANMQPLKFNRNILVDGVSFKYPGSKSSQINNLTINIEKNSFIGIVGETGAGKTTTIDLLLGLLKPDEGNIKVDDVVLDDKNIKSWREMIGYVPQNIHLLDTTIKNNIAYGVEDDNIDLEKVIKVSRMANIEDFILNEAKQAYDTNIGDRGIKLSGGQRQRIGIARALYKDPKILLLDEATSSLDGITEKEVMKAIRNMKHNITIIIIAHRLNTVRECDRVYMLKKGAIADSGTYESLLETNNSFKKMNGLIN